MTRNRKNILYTFILLIAFFAFNINVNAISKCTISKSAGPLYGDVIDTSTGDSIKSFTYSARCDGNPHTCVALCIDPGLSSPNSHATYSTQYTSDYENKLLKALGQLYAEEGCNSTTCILKYQTAARILSFQDNQFGQRSYQQTTSLTKAYDAFANGTAYIDGAESLAWEAKNLANNMPTTSGYTGDVEAEFVDGYNGVELRVSGLISEPTSITFTVGNDTYTISGDVVKQKGSFQYGVYTTSINSDNYFWADLVECTSLDANISYIDGDRDENSYPGDEYGNGLPNNSTAAKLMAPENGGDWFRYQHFIIMCNNGNNSGNNSNGGKNESHISTSTRIGSKSRKNSNSIDISYSSGYGQLEICNPICLEEDCPPDDDIQNESCSFNPSITCLEQETNEVSKEVHINEGTPNGEGKTDWEKCIIHNQDTKNNTYDIKPSKTLASDTFIYDGTWQTVSDANFCTISCKEEYVFDMPANKKNTLVGTYFDFDIAHANPYHAIVGVKSERQCVTSSARTSTGGIDIATYEKRIISLRKQQIDFMNAYLYYNAMIDALNEFKWQYINGDVSSGYGLPSGSSYKYDSGDHSKSDDFNFDNWYGSEYNDNPIIQPGAPNLSFYVTQYYLTNPDSIDSQIETTSIYGNANTSFRNSNETIKYLANSVNYCTVYPKQCSIFNLDGYISPNFTYDENDYNYKEQNNNSSNNSGTCVTYERDLDTNEVRPIYYDCNNDNDNEESYEEKQGTAEIRFQTSSQREAAINDTINTLERFVNGSQSVSSKVSSLSAQISNQNTGMQACLDQFNQVGEYKFDPEITWDYDQTDYLNMMNSKQLEIKNGNPELNNSKYYCSADYNGRAADVFDSNICINVTDENYNPNKITIEYLKSADIQNLYDNKNEFEYTRASRIGTSSKYECNGTYCYYGSGTAFYTNPPDGKVTNYKTTNSTMIDKDVSYKDGYVFPVSITSKEGTHYYSLTFKNIGQYLTGENGGNLGRIMGSDNAVMDGEVANKAVCTYELTTPKGKCDPTIEDCTCEDIVDKQCTDENGNYYKANTSDSDSCVTTLIENSCCNEVSKIIHSPGGGIGPNAMTKYNQACGPAESCVGFEIVDGISSVNDGISYADSVSVNSDFNTNGALKFSVRTVSLNNLFPNNVKGTNWQEEFLRNTSNGTYGSKGSYGSRGLTISEIIDVIQENGESIYGREPDYSIIMTPECSRKIRENNKYNDYDNGFISYNLSIIDDSKYLAGSVASNEEFFRDLEDNYGCIVNRRKNAEGIEPNNQNGR